MGYTRSVISGFGWQTGLKILTSGLALIKIAILARLLSPDDFGLFSLAIVALGLTEAFTQTGINTTIIQSKQPTGYFLDTAWIIAIIRGIIIGLVMFGMAFGLSYLYHKPTLRPLIFLAATIPIIKGFINPYIINWYKTLQYSKETILYFFLALIEAAIAVLFSIWLGSTFALVWALVISALVELVLSFILFSKKPTFSYSKKVGAEILNNAKGLTLSSALNYANNNLDDMIVGKSLGTHGLGLYHNGYALGHKANYELSIGAFHSLLPIFSRVKGDVKRFRRGFDRALLVMAGLTLLTTLPLVIFPKLIVQIVLGKNWLAVVPIVPWLAMAGWVHGIESIVYSGWVATKKYALLNSHLFFNIIIMIPTLWWMSQAWGLKGAGIAILTTRLMTLPIIIFGTHSLRRSKNEN